jgi:hypothetical protein
MSKAPGSAQRLSRDVRIALCGNAVYCAQVLRDSRLVGESKPTLRRRSEKTPYIVPRCPSPMTGRFGEGPPLILADHVS